MNSVQNGTPIGVGENFSFFICRRPPDEIKSYTFEKDVKREFMESSIRKTFYDKYFFKE